MTAPILKRARRGSIERVLSLRMPADLKRDIDRAARIDRITVTEWIRRAVRAELERR